MPSSRPAVAGEQTPRNIPTHQAMNKKRTAEQQWPDEAAHPPLRQQRQTPDVMFENTTIRRALPGQLFYSTQIPVCLGFLAKNKNADARRGFRDRRQLTNAALATGPTSMENKA